MRQLDEATDDRRAELPRLDAAYPPGWTSYDGTGEPGWGWAPRILLYAEQRNLAQSIDYGLPLSHPVNRGAAQKRLAMFLCPSHNADMVDLTAVTSVGKIKVTLAPASYVGNFGSVSFENCDVTAPSTACQGNGVFYHNSFVRMSQISDGVSNTLLFGERSGGPTDAIWGGVLPGDKHALGRILGHSGTPPNDPDERYGYNSHHPRGAQFSFGDGAIRFLHDDIDPTIFRAMATRAGRELRDN